MLSQGENLTRQIALVTLGLLLFGLVMLFSASAILGLQKFHSEFYFVNKQATIAVLGVLTLVGLSRLDFKIFQRFVYPIMGIQVVLTLITLVPSLSHSVQGVSRWIRLGPLSFQPSELAKIAVSIYGAHIATLWGREELNLKRAILHLLPILILLGCFYRQPDLGSTILLTALLLGLFFIAGGKTKVIVSMLGIGFVLFTLALWRSDYQRKRVLTFLNPWDDPQGMGFQTIQSFLSLHNGRFSGVGIGNGNGKLFFLPEVHTDFIFSLIGEELGFLGAIFLLAAFAYLGYLCLKVSDICKDPFGRYLAFGLSLSLLMQIAVNLGGVTGLLPVKGLPLPFISWGKSALFVNLSMMGILLNVSRQSVIISPSKKKSIRRKKSNKQKK